MILRLLHGDCVERMAELPEGSVQIVSCDPPYDLTTGSSKGFMGKAWDGTGIAFTPRLWNEVFRVLEPGGTVKAFGGTRTFHRMAVAMEAAGFINVGLESWGYGSGFPKSLDVSKALDKMHGAQRGTVKTPFTGNALMRSGGQNTRPWMEEALKKGFHEAPGKDPVTDDAKLWNGWGTALKPAWEPVLVGYKPGGPVGHAIS